MSKIRVMLLSILAVFAVSAVSATAASAAPQYFVAGVAFNGEEAIEANPKAGTSAVLVSKLTGGATIEIVCTAGKLTSAVIKEKFKGSGKAIVYEKCSVKTPVSCKVSETLTTNEVVAEAVDTGTTGVSVVFSPKIAGGTFITIAVTGCAGEGSCKVTGSAECEGLEPTVEAVKKTCKFTTTSGTNLKFGVNTATLTQESEFFLNGAKKGSVWHIQH